MSNEKKSNEGSNSSASGKFDDTLVKKIFKCPHCGREIKLQTRYPDQPPFNCVYCGITMTEVSPNDN